MEVLLSLALAIFSFSVKGGDAMRNVQESKVFPRRNHQSGASKDNLHSLWLFVIV